MKKKTIPLLSALMTASFIILVALQFYFFKEILNKSEDDFSTSVNHSLEVTSEKINNQEIQKYYKLFGNFYDEATQKKDITTRQVINSVIDSGDFRYIAYTNYLIEKKSLPIPFSQGDTLQNTQVAMNENAVKILRDSNDSKVPEKLSQELETSIESGEFSLQNFARLNADEKPINQRVNKRNIREILENELQKRGIDGNFDIAILNNNGEYTDIKDPDYASGTDKNYKTVLFSNKEDQPQYYLSIYFPSKNASVLKPYLIPLTITMLATVIVIIIYIISIYYMNRQKKISEIKTDFINNMTHEFKTPIATINIATSALKNKNVNAEPEKINYYANLIKSENDRMNTQVEKILQMSRLENNQLHLNQDLLKVNDLIRNAIDSTRLSVEDRNGTIIEYLNANEAQVEGDAFHLTNSIINLIDNANKYSPTDPQIKVSSEIKNGNVYIHVTDEGIGINPANKKKLFEKFFREETGDVHNVKGHGLGLTYVKEIIEKLGGEISVESELGKGSTFTLKLPQKV